jgi:hypothetical protein
MPDSHTIGSTLIRLLESYYFWELGVKILAILYSFKPVRYRNAKLSHHWVDLNTIVGILLFSGIRSENFGYFVLF